MRASKEEQPVVIDEPHTVVVPDMSRRRRSQDRHLIPTLTLLEGPEVGAFFAFDPDREIHRVGRADDADIQIRAASVSRYHALFILAERDGHPGVRVEDNGSTNGVMVNGDPVKQMWLVSGDKVRLGDILLRFAWLSDEEIRYHSSVSAKIQVGQRDHLTGLLTRSFFDTKLDNLLGEWDQRGQSATCFMIDLDHFKGVNDNFGHLVGDQVLRASSEVLQSSLRRTDIPVRYGGEEILLLMPDLDLEGAAIVGERFRHGIETYPWSGVAAGLEVTASLGAAERRPGESAWDWFGRADGALYRAKKGGRNRLVMARAEAGEETDRREGFDTQADTRAHTAPVQAIPRQDD